MLKYFPDEIGSFDSIFTMVYIFALGFTATYDFFYKNNDFKYSIIFKLTWIIVILITIMCFAYPKYWIISPLISIVAAINRIKIINIKFNFRRIIIEPYVFVVISALGFIGSEFRKDILNNHKYQIINIIASNTVVNISGLSDIYVSLPLLAGIPFIGPLEYEGYAHISKVESGNSLCDKGNYFVSYRARITNGGPVLSLFGEDIRQIHCY